jgi:hypothetical protein
MQCWQQCFCTCDGKKSFLDLTVWSDEATFKLNGVINHHNFVCFTTERSNVMEEWAVNLPGPLLWCSRSSREMLWPFFFQVTVTGTAYLTILEDDIIPCINIFSDKDCYFQHDGAPPYYHTDVRNFLNVHFPGRWRGWGASVDCPLWSPDLTPSDFSP